MIRSALFCQLVTIALLVSYFATSVPADAADSGDELHLHQQSASHMGTQWHIALYSRSPSAANTAFSAAWNVIETADRRLSNYRVDSELNQLCNSAPHENPVPVSEDLWAVLRAADALSRESDGAFDVTIGPVSKLWRRARRKKQLPTSEQLRNARAVVGYRLVEFDEKNRRVALSKAGMKLDLGGIAKGYAVDKALRCLEELGIESALVNGGGDIAVMGTTSKRDGWEIEVAGLDPRKGAKRILLKDAAIATSGDAWQFIKIDGKRYSHIIDPATGLGTTDRKTVSVVARDCMTADSLASALCVLPTQRGLELVRNHRANTRYLFAVKDTSNETKLVSTAGFPLLHDAATSGLTGAEP